MVQSITAPPYPASTRLRVVHNGTIQDESPPPYDAGGPRYAITVGTDVVRTILSRLGTSAYGVYSFLETYCNVEGHAWPSVGTIAAGCRLSERQTQRMLQLLSDEGWLRRKDVANRFGMTERVVYSLPHHQKIAAKSQNANPVNADESGGDITPEKDAIETEVMRTDGGDIGGDIGGDTMGPIVSPKVIPELDTKVSTKTLATPTKSRASPLPENGPAQQIVKAFCAEVGIPKPVNYGKAVGLAQQLVRAGVVAGDIPGAVAWCRGQDWLRDGFDLGTIVSQADKWRAAKVQSASKIHRVVM